MSSCDAVRQRLAEAGIEAAERQADIRRHLEGCEACRSVLAALDHVDGTLEDLPTHDPPDSLVADTLVAVRRAAREETSPPPGPGMRYLAGGLAASVVIAAGLGLTLGLLDSQYQSKNGGSEVAQIGQASGWGEEQLAQGPVAQNKPNAYLRSNELSVSETEAVASIQEESGRRSQLRASEESLDNFEVARLAEKKAEVEEYRAQREMDERLGGQSLHDSPGEAGAYEQEWAIIAQLEQAPPAGDRDAVRHRRDESTEGESLDRLERPAAPGTSVPRAKAKNEKRAGDGHFADLGEVDYFAGTPVKAAPDRQTGAGVAAEPESRTAPEVVVRGLLKETPESAMDAEEELPTSELSSADELNRAVKSDDDKELAAALHGADPGRGGEEGASRLKSELKARPIGGVIVSDQREVFAPRPPADTFLARLRARAFLDEYRTPDGMPIQEASGYWANTYIPGDPAMRLLEARLRDWNRAALGQDLTLEQDVRQVRQPFDAPQDAAVAVYLHADTPVIEGPTRFRVQVGLKGAERQGGHRPAMNVGLVVDLRDATDAELGRRVRALISALERARQPGDRFSLTVAGPAGGLLVQPEDFRHGPLRVALERMFDTAGDAAAPGIDLQQALAVATESVRAGDDPEAILGSSLVLLATGGSLAEDLSALERMAHRNAVGGIPLSVVDLGGQENLTHIDRLVAAGQGSRRILGSAQAADGVIDRELHAASRAVARALRLRIRLAPGVKLVDVLGSRRLAEPQADQVREAEQAIDQRLARNLGIEADRGVDEAGIQMVIPNFYAGDAHVVLLDVVAEKPGPIADVTVRYKDVAYLRNGVARASLSIGQGQRVVGPLERNVLKNLVAWRFAAGLRQVGQSLAAGDDRTAMLRLVVLRDLVHGLRHEVAGWASDPDLAADETLLDRYLAILNSPPAGDSVQRRFLADSLHYAAFRKLQSAAR